MLRLAEANEAETRLKLIDRIIFEVLGWRHDDASVEERVSEDGHTTFSDYVLRTGFSSLVIEAKRSGRSDLVVADKRKVLLNRKLVSGDTGDAIIQARDYGRKLSIPFAVVTNGDQWVVFPATRTDEVPFDKSSAIIFPNIQALLHKSAEGRGSPSPGQTHPTASVTGMPSAVKPFRTTTRI
jgi:predicted type IV restriction endonuclease